MRERRKQKGKEGRKRKKWRDRGKDDLNERKTATLRTALKERGEEAESK